MGRSFLYEVMLMVVCGTEEKRRVQAEGKVSMVASRCCENPPSPEIHLYDDEIVIIVICFA